MLNGGLKGAVHCFQGGVVFLLCKYVLIDAVNGSLVFEILFVLKGWMFFFI